jgi:biotin carboxyl carrier protein
MDDTENQIAGTNDTPAPAPSVPVAPTAVTSATPGVRVIDAASGDVIEKVISADSAAGTVTRFAVEDGNLVRENDAFVIVKEDRPIRIEILSEGEA